jgi:hypothetical protein
MILYNVTIALDETIASEWVEWMNRTHIPEVMATECFTEYRFYKILSNDIEANPTFSVQYKAESLSMLNTYMQKHAPQLQQKSLARYGDKAVAFRTVLREVEGI